MTMKLIDIDIIWWWVIAQFIAILFKIYGWVDFIWWIIFIPTYCVIAILIIFVIYVIWYVNHL